MNKDNLINIDETARKISSIINTLCKEEAVLTKNSLINRLVDNGVKTTTATKLLMPLRKKGIIVMARGKKKSEVGLYFFKKRIQPIYYKEFESLLISFSSKKTTIKRQVKTKVSNSYWVSTDTLGISVILNLIK